MVFPKSNWIVFILIGLLALSACGENSTVTAKPSSSSSKLLVYVPGLTESLSKSDIAKNHKYGIDESFYSSGSINAYLQGKYAFKGAATIVYSYGGFTVDGKPNVFFCSDTFNNRLLYDESLLNLQIIQYLKSHINTDVYLIGHSLGGVIAFSYMIQIEQGNSSNAIMDDGKVLGHLKGLAIEDSPLGGISNDSNYQNAIIVRSLKCPNEVINFTSIADLQELFITTSSKSQQGATASILNAILQGRYISNQQIALDASQKGVRIVVVGNLNDLLWNPDVCNEILHISMPNFNSTQFLDEKGEQNGGGALYVRSFFSGGLSCSVNPNHIDVLKNTNVENIIWEVFTEKKADQLTPVTGVNPFSVTVTPKNTQTPVLPTPDLNGGTPDAPSGSLKPTPGIKPTAQPTILPPTPMPPTSIPGIKPFVGKWATGALTLVISSDGSGTYSDATSKSVLQFTNVQASVLYGTIVSGGSIIGPKGVIPVGGSIKVTLDIPGTVTLSSGVVLCSSSQQCA